MTQALRAGRLSRRVQGRRFVRWGAGWTIGDGVRLDRRLRRRARIHRRRRPSRHRRAHGGRAAGARHRAQRGDPPARGAVLYLPNLYADIKGIPRLFGGTAWAGTRYYKRESVYISDFFHWNPSGVGAGLGGDNKLAFQYGEGGGTGLGLWLASTIPTSPLPKPGTDPSWRVPRNQGRRPVR